MDVKAGAGSHFASYARSDGRSNYDSLSYNAERRVGWVAFDAHWTWSHGMYDYLNLENPYNTGLWNRDFLARHRVVFNTVWELPFGRGRKYMNNAHKSVDEVLGGWRLIWVAYMPISSASRKQAWEWSQAPWPVEMLEPWKPWKANSGLATAPWRSRNWKSGTREACRLLRLRAKFGLRGISLHCCTTDTVRHLPRGVCEERHHNQRGEREQNPWYALFWGAGARQVRN